MATYAHELTHNLGLPDNYNNPFGTVQQVTATGMWDMMSRGSFNGPGGQHTRYLIPPTQGAALGSQHNMRNKRVLNFLTDNDLLRLNRDGLAQSGMAVADVTAREIAPTGGEISGVNIALDGTGDNEAPCNSTAHRPELRRRRTHGHGTITGKYNNYTMEVVQQIGSDSFDPGHGVLISKTKNTTSSCGTFSCFVWVVDAHPEDINQVDFVARRRHAEDGDDRRRAPEERRVVQRRPRTRAPRTSTRTPPNRLHFYIIDKRTDAQGILHYTVGVKSLDGAGPQTRGVALALAAARQRRGLHDLHVQPDEHGRGGGRTAGRAPAGRLGVPRAATSTGSRRRPPAPAGRRTSRTRSRRPSSASRSRSRSTSRRAPAPARSRSTRSPRAIRPRPRRAVCTLADCDGRRLGPGDAGADHGRAGVASARSRPGLGKDYFASTAANVISTAGDATLSRRRPGHDHHRPPGQRRVLAAVGRCRPAAPPTAPTRRSAARPRRRR